MHCVNRFKFYTVLFIWFFRLRFSLTNSSFSHKQFFLPQTQHTIHSLTSERWGVPGYIATSCSLDYRSGIHIAVDTFTFDAVGCCWRCSSLYLWLKQIVTINKGLPIGDGLSMKLMGWTVLHRVYRFYHKSRIYRFIVLHYYTCKHCYRYAGIRSPKA